MNRTTRSPDRRLSPFAVWFAAIFLALLLVGRERMFRDPGTLWHTVVGERMLDTRQVIRTDPFSFTCEGRPWIAQQWLAECLMALLHRAASLDGLLLGAAALLAAAYASIAARLMARGAGPAGAAIVVALVVGASSFHFHARPHVFTIAFAAWTFGALCDVESGRAASRRLWLLPLVLALWTNLHGGALGGVLTILLALAGWIAVMRLTSPRSARGVPVLVAVGAAVVAAVLVNPFGLELPRVWLALMNSRVLPAIMQEHGPLEPGSPEAWMIFALAALYVGVLFDSRRVMLRVTWLLPLVWLVLAVSRIRHAPIFAVLAAVAVAEMLPCSALLTVLRDRRSLFAASGVGSSPPRAGRWAAPALVLLVLAVQTLGWRLPLIGAGWARLSPDYWPVEAVQQLAEAAPETARPRVFNQMSYGGYLIYALPSARVYIDDRCELYGDGFLKAYDALMRDPAGFDTEASRWNFDFAIVSSRSRLAEHLRANRAWRVVHRDDTATLFQPQN